MHSYSRYNVLVELSDGGLMVNTLHQSRIRLGAEVFEAVYADRNPDMLDDCLVQELSGLGMLVPDGADERNAALRLHRQERDGSRALQLTIATTVGCNLGCSYCLERDKAPRRLSREDEVEIAAFARGQLRGRRAFEVVWFGGEPLLNLDSILRLSTQFIRMSSLRGVAYSAAVITNGVLLSEDKARALHQAHVRRARITLDGPRAVHNTMRPSKNGSSSYDAVLAGLKVAVRYFDTALGVNLDRTNTLFIESMLEELADVGLTDLHVFFAPVIPPGEDSLGETAEYGGGRHLTMPEFAREEARLLKIAARMGFRVTADFGQQGALPCSALQPDHYALEPGKIVKRCYADVSTPARTVGHLENGGFAQDDEQKSRDKNWSEYDAFDEECLDCRYLPICYGGCPKLRMSGRSKEEMICTPRRFNLGEVLSLTEEV